MSLHDELRECTGFDWDEGNSGKSWTRHQVRDGECEEVFFNRPLLVAPDEGHSANEDRILVLGQTDAARKLFLACTIRERLIRVISARDMTKREREAYYTYG